jgi:hypothetical protein
VDRRLESSAAGRRKDKDRKKIKEREKTESEYLEPESQ